MIDVLGFWGVVFYEIWEFLRKVMRWWYWVLLRLGIEDLLEEEVIGLLEKFCEIWLFELLEFVFLDIFIFRVIFLCFCDFL